MGYRAGQRQRSCQPQQPTLSRSSRNTSTNVPDLSAAATAREYILTIPETQMFRKPGHTTSPTGLSGAKRTKNRPEGHRLHTSLSTSNSVGLQDSYMSSLALWKSFNPPLSQEKNVHTTSQASLAFSGIYSQS